jgi:hypothetical protein
VDAAGLLWQVDWRRSFITTDHNSFYDSFVRWQFNTLRCGSSFSSASSSSSFLLRLILVLLLLLLLRRAFPSEFDL